MLFQKKNFFHLIKKGILYLIGDYTYKTGYFLFFYCDTCLPIPITQITMTNQIVEFLKVSYFKKELKY